MQLKTGVQIICGFYAIISSLILVSYYATLEKSIIDKYVLYFGSKTQYAQYQQQYTNNPNNVPSYDKPDTTLIEVRTVYSHINLNHIKQKKLHQRVIRKAIDLILSYLSFF